MITVKEYFGKWFDHHDATDERKENAEDLLVAVNKLEEMARADGVTLPINPTTGSRISGQQYGGFRPQTCSQGASRSSHKEGMGGDLYDPVNELDDWITKFNTEAGKRNSVLEECGLYREHPDDTDTWCHLTTRKPGSGWRTFHP